MEPWYKTRTKNGIEFEAHIMNDLQSRFVLYPINGVNTEEDVKNAATELRGGKDLLSLQVRWKNPNDDTPNPEKIPDYLIIKNLKRELGKITAYAEELEEKLKQKEEMKLTPEQRGEIKKTEMYQSQKAQIRKLEIVIQGLRKDKDTLLYKLNYQSKE